MLEERNRTLSSRKDANKKNKKEFNLISKDYFSKIEENKYQIIKGIFLFR